MGRSPCCQKAGLKKGRWTAEEDEILLKYVRANGEGSWRSLPKNAGLLRCGKSCRLRWINYLRAGIKRGNISPEEEHIIINLHASFGNRWSLIASHLPGRTDNEIKNYWNSHLCRRIPKANIPSKRKGTPKTQRPNHTHHVYEAVPLPNTPVLENERIPTAFDDLLVFYEENKEEGKETNQTLGAYEEREGIHGEARQIIGNQSGVTCPNSNNEIAMRNEEKESWEWYSCSSVASDFGDTVNWESLLQPNYKESESFDDRDNLLSWLWEDDDVGRRSLQLGDRS